jgi:hypothetical protein
MYGEWIYISTFLWSRHSIEVSGQLPFSCGFSLGETALGNHCTRGWATPELAVWAIWKSENSWLYQDSNSHSSVVQPVVSRYTDYLVLFWPFIYWSKRPSPFRLRAYTTWHKLQKDMVPKCFKLHEDWSREFKRNLDTYQLYTASHSAADLECNVTRPVTESSVVRRQTIATDSNFLRLPTATKHTEEMYVRGGEI